MHYNRTSGIIDICHEINLKSLNNTQWQAVKRVENLEMTHRLCDVGLHSICILESVVVRIWNTPPLNVTQRVRYENVIYVSVVSCSQKHLLVANLFDDCSEGLFLKTLNKCISKPAKYQTPKKTRKALIRLKPFEQKTKKKKTRGEKHRLPFQRPKYLIICGGRCGSPIGNFGVLWLTNRWPIICGLASHVEALGTVSMCTREGHGRSLRFFIILK